MALSPLSEFSTNSAFAFSPYHVTANPKTLFAERTLFAPFNICITLHMKQKKPRGLLNKW